MNASHKLPPPLSPEDFSAFFRAIHTYDPLLWQQRLAKIACTGEWPDFLQLPTASGKTAAIDIAVFAMAYRAADQNRSDDMGPPARRLFFVVDRRIVVNEAYQRAKKIAHALWDAVNYKRISVTSPADEKVLAIVAHWLRHLARDEKAPPLDFFELRGGIYRDDAWVRSPLQPTVLTSTVDQVGSRVLFRGYGVSDRNLSLHAALTANDSLIVLDEAHCSRPFSQTLTAIEKYRRGPWAEEMVSTPFQFVQMTATPPSDLDAARLFQLQEYERTERLLEKRHGCPKPVQLKLSRKAKHKHWLRELANDLAAEAVRLASEHNLRRIAVVVNRVNLARKVEEKLREEHGADVQLMIGRMRPLDRECLTAKLQSQFGTGRKSKPEQREEDTSRFVVATQCLEVGADLDFDGMVCQCASLDALEQRFGRLNRLGEWDEARGVVMIADGDLAEPKKLDDAKPLDPIYGNAAARTWHWLTEQAQPADDDNDSVGEVDFGIWAIQSRKAKAKEDSFPLTDLSVRPVDAPVLLPAHLDMFSQTSPRPTPDPDVAPYLHGLDRATDAVRICWRADLDLSDPSDSVRLDRWLKAVDICPPSSIETMPVPRKVLQDWLRGKRVDDRGSDLLAELVEPDNEDSAPNAMGRTALVWRGRSDKRGTEPDNAPRSFLADAANVRGILPNDTIVIPAEFGGWKQLGHVPDAPDDPSVDRESFPTIDPVQLHRLLLHRHANHELEESVANLAKVDIADAAFFQSRARSLLRVHPKLSCDDNMKNLWTELLAWAKDDEADISVKRLQAEAKNRFGAENTPSSSVFEASPYERLARYNDNTIGQGTVVRYPGGLAWTTGRYADPRPGMLSLASFGDDEDSLSHTKKISLRHHLSDVAQQAKHLCAGLTVAPHLAETAVRSAWLHDLGKADPHFQANLIGKPVSAAHMQPKLWAKSEAGTNRTNSPLPRGFRHEMLSLAIIDHCGLSPEQIETFDVQLLRHLVAAHHGHARPFAPFCPDEDSPVAIHFKDLSLPEILGEDRQAWRPPYRLDSGIAERFWKLNRRFGWWGLAYLESLLRLADWAASAQPSPNEPDSGEIDSLFLLARQTPAPSTDSGSEHSLTLSGIDGSNPLGFLAAVGTLRSLTESGVPIRLHWQRTDGAWRPILTSPQPLTEAIVLDRLGAFLSAPAQLPLLEEIGPNLTISGATFRELAEKAIDACHNASVDDLPACRVAADFLAAFGCDVMTADNGLIKDTAFRTMSGAGHQHFLAFMREIFATTQDSHLHSTLFQSWRYEDEGRGANLRWDPIDDRRYAARWQNPSNDPNKTMRGANRLAIEALPLFPTAIANGKLETTGFHRRDFSWPVWHVPIDLEVCESLLRSPYVQAFSTLKAASGATRDAWQHQGLAAVFQSERITVGKFRNFTPAKAI